MGYDQSAKKEGEAVGQRTRQREESEGENQRA
jgi:hypothetical protein